MSATRLSTRTRAAQISIDTEALQHNLQRVKHFAPDSKVMAVIKANAYGHGITTVSEALSKADGFALAMCEEALQLRAAGVQHKLLVLHGFQTVEQLVQLAEQGIAAVIHHETQLALLEKYRGVALDIWLKFDTGMHRLGFPLADADTLVARLQACKGVSQIRLLSHFANADQTDNILNTSQLGAFNQIVKRFDFESSMANSAALISQPQSQLDWLRPGIMLYGSSPFNERTAAELGLKPVMSFSAPVLAVKELKGGDSVGYGSTWLCQRDTRVALVAAGYADGYPRDARAGTPVHINGQRCALIGRVSMDSICVELGGLEVAIGDTAELWGQHVSIDEVARYAGTISYELLCQAGNAAGLV